MQKEKIGKIRRVIIVSLLIYILTGLLLYYFQDKILFHPEKLSPDYEFSFNVPFNELNVAVNKEKNLNIIQFTVPDSVCKGVVLYFHGNRKNINRYAPFAENFTRSGYAVWMMDYPGYGKSTGERTEQILYDDAMRVYQIASKKFSPDSIIIYGKSLGTCIATQLASVKSCKRLILETPYYSIDALAKRYFFIYPVKPMTDYSFPTYKFFRSVNSPVTIFHGTNDGTIPYNHSKRLLKLKPGAELVTLEKGRHNNLHDFPQYQKKIDSLLSL
jgi:uncharacterized protein